jgi:hypothetical protein
MACAGKEAEVTTAPAGRKAITDQSYGMNRALIPSTRPVPDGNQEPRIAATVVVAC